MPNWYDGERRDTLRVQCVNPTDYGHVGWLNATGATLTEAYYSDTRIQGTLSALDAESYVPLSMVRLIHEADFRDGEHYRQVLGTFFAIRSRDSWKGGAHVTEFELKSVLYGMKDDLAPFNMTLAEGSMAQAAYNDICSRCNRRRRWVSGANDKKFAKNTVLEMGKSRLSWLHQLADLSGNRIDCDPDGYVTISKYTAPSRRTAKAKLAFNSALVLASGIERASDEMKLPSRSIVTWEHEYKVKVKDGTYKSAYTDSDGVYHAKGSVKYKEKTERKTIIDYAEVEAGSPAHINRRGFRVAAWHAEDDLGDSKATAQAKAREYLEEESQATTSWSLSTRWWEVHEGDIVSWKPSEDEPYRKCIVTAADKDLFSFTIRLTLKEV